MRRWMNGHAWQSRPRWGAATAGLADWPMFWPGLILLLMGTLVLVEPGILVVLIAAAMIALGTSRLVSGWRARRAWRCLDSTFWRGFTRYP